MIKTKDIQYMKTMLYSLSLYLVLTLNVSALDPQKIAVAPAGWNATQSGYEYFTTPMGVPFWTLEIWKGTWQSTQYEYSLVKVLYNDAPGYYDFVDARTGTNPPGGPADIVLMLFHSYGDPLLFSNSAPVPQGFFQTDDYGSGQWYSRVGWPPLWTTWSIWRSFHNAARADETELQMVDCGYETKPEAHNKIIQLELNMPQVGWYWGQGPYWGSLQYP